MTREKFLELFQENDPTFNMCNVKLSRTQLPGSDTSPSVSMTIGRATTYDYSAKVTQSAADTLKPLQDLNAGSGAILVADIAIFNTPHYGIGALHDDSGKAVARYGDKVLCVVKGATRSTSQAVGSGKKVTSIATNALADSDAKYTLHTYCPENRETDYKLDRQTAIVSITTYSADAQEYEVESITIIPPFDVGAAKDAILRLGHLCMACVGSSTTAGGKKRAPEMFTPDSMKKCKVLESWPSDSA